MLSGPLNASDAIKAVASTLYVRQLFYQLCSATQIVIPSSRRLLCSKPCYSSKQGLIRSPTPDLNLEAKSREALTAALCYISNSTSWKRSRDLRRCQVQQFPELLTDLQHPKLSDPCQQQLVLPIQAYSSSTSSSNAQVDAVIPHSQGPDWQALHAVSIRKAVSIHYGSSSSTALHQDDDRRFTSSSSSSSDGSTWQNRICQPRGQLGFSLPPVSSLSELGLSALHKALFGSLGPTSSCKSNLWGSRQYSTDPSSSSWGLASQYSRGVSSGRSRGLRQYSTASHNGVRQYTTDSNSSSSSSSSTSASSRSSSSEPPKNLKGGLPGDGPAHKSLRALPFTVTRAAAAEAFAAYHGRNWYQSRQRPLLAKPFKETFLPFWVGSGVVSVEVTGAEVGHEHLVTRYDKATRRSEPRWETVWSRVKLHLAWDRQLRAEEPDVQLYASWKYPRSDVDALRPGPLVSIARPITPDMLQASAGAGTDTRRVGPFTVTPVDARKLLVSQVEAAERARAQQEIARLTGAQQVRFVDMHCTYVGSTGAARGKAAAAGDAAGGLDLSPVYVPAYIFSWWHGGAKVRTFVSGVNAAAVSGVQVLDDTKLATYATLATAGLGLFLGLPANLLLWGALVVPFVSVGLVSRFWPLVRSTFVGWKERLQQRWKDRTSGADYCEVDWNASFVHAYEAQETRRRQQEQRQSYWQDHRHGPFGGATQDPREFFQQFMRDPFSWFEQQFAKQQQQQGYQGYQQRGRQQQQQRQQQQSWQQQFGGGGGATAGPRGDPLSYYSTLGVKPGCSTQEVQAAFRGLALKHHPDRYSSAADKEKATKKFQTITEAYHVLRDLKKRQLYDAGQYRA